MTPKHVGTNARENDLQENEIYNNRLSGNSNQVDDNAWQNYWMAKSTCLALISSSAYFWEMQKFCQFIVTGNECQVNFKVLVKSSRYRHRSISTINFFSHVNNLVSSFCHFYNFTDSIQASSWYSSFNRLAFRCETSIKWNWNWRVP